MIDNIIDVNNIELGVVEPVKEQKKQKPKTRTCTVISYNKQSGMLVFECDGKIYQSNSIEYDGISPTFEWKIR